MSKKTFPSLKIAPLQRGDLQRRKGFLGHCSLRSEYLKWMISFEGLALGRGKVDLKVVRPWCRKLAIAHFHEQRQQGIVLLKSNGKLDIADNRAEPTSRLCMGYGFTANTRTLAA